MNLQEKALELKQELQKTILGQPRLIERLLLALFANGHLLVEGAPGLAKTKSIKALSNLIEADFHRVQFTPDLMPADITGTEIYEQSKGAFHFQKGPIFHNLILADEINRAPAKVQSALLEAMGEKQVSVGKQTYPLPELFLVMATQNPIEQEGTFNLPEAQLDRFMMHVKIDYPDAEVEKQILKLNQQEELKTFGEHKNKAIKLTQNDIFAIRKEVLTMHMDESLQDYLIQLIMATRKPKKYNDELALLIDYGASPRASIYLERCAKAFAWMKNKDYVSLSDIHELVHEILRHRIGLTFKAESEGLNADQVIDEIIRVVPQP